MRYKMDDNDKKKKISVSINNNLYDLIEDDVSNNKIKKSQIIEKALTEYKDKIENTDLTELELFNLINKLKNKDNK